MNAAQAIQAHLAHLKAYEVAALVGVSKGAWSLYCSPTGKKPREDTIDAWLERLAERGHEVVITRSTVDGCTAERVERVEP